MKICSTCKIEKDEIYFSKRIGAIDGLRGQCKECKNKAYREGYGDRYSKSDKGKEVRKKYQQSQARRISESKYRRSEKGRLKCYNSYKKYKESNPDKVKAHKILNHKIESGLISKPSKCSYCCKENKLINGHHYDYSKPLDVVWLCPKCHKDVHLNKIKLEFVA